MTAEEARRSAAEVIYRIRRGEEPFPAPAAPEPTMVDLAGRFMKAHAGANCKPGVRSWGRALEQRRPGAGLARLAQGGGAIPES